MPCGSPQQGCLSIDAGCAECAGKAECAANAAAYRSPAAVLKAAAAVQGLWHPARKVREVYWRLYNNLYIGSQDALVACFPRMQDEGMNTFTRHEMDVFI